jgi:hypothetical protein
MGPVAMRRVGWLCLAWSAAAASVIVAAPARLPYEPPPPPPAVVDLRGTSWEGKDHVEGYRVTFEPDGTLTYGYNKMSHRGGSWQQSGNNLYWEVNQQYREFKGSVAGNVLQGESWNKAGKRWQTFLMRVK